MDGFSLEMAGGDLLDLGSFGLFGDNTTINSSSSPSSGIPLSLGTPTGVASLQAAQAAMYGDNEDVDKHHEHDTSLDNDLSTDDPSESTANQNETTTTATSSTSATDFFSTFTAQQNAENVSSSSPSGGGSFTKALDSIPTTLMGSSAMNMTQSSARPHIPTSSVPMGGQSMSMGNPMSAGMMHQQHERAQPNPGFNAYANEMASIKQQLMMQPDLIPPPPQVIHAGQQYMMMAARMGGQMYMPPQQQMMMQGQMGVGPQMYGGMAPNMMNVGHSPSAAMEAARQQQLRQQHLQQQRAQMAGGVQQQVAWQSEADIPLRRKMIAKIVSLLQQRKPDAPPEWIKKLPDMARRLEDSLYRTASNRTEYGNFSTLKHRLQQLAITMGAKSARGRSAPPSHPVSSSVASTPTMGGSNVSYSGGMQQFSGAGTPTHQQMMQQLQLQAQIQQMQAAQQAEMHRRNSIQMQQQQQVQAQLQQQQHQQQQQKQQQQTQAQPNSASPAPGTPQSQATPTTTTDDTSQPQQREQTPIPDLQEVDDADFLNFDLSPSMGGALEFDLDRNTPPQQDTEKYGSENGSDT